MNIIELVHEVDAEALERARRLEYAIRLIHQGHARREISGKLKEHFNCSRMTAWRTMSVAWDMAGNDADA